jgi:hypothetical protein
MIIYFLTHLSLLAYHFTVRNHQYSNVNNKVLEVIIFDLGIRYQILTTFFRCTNEQIVFTKDSGQPDLNIAGSPEPPSLLIDDPSYRNTLRSECFILLPLLLLLSCWLQNLLLLGKISYFSSELLSLKFQLVLPILKASLIDFGNIYSNLMSYFQKVCSIACFSSLILFESASSYVLRSVSTILSTVFFSLLAIKTQLVPTYLPFDNS